MSYEPDSSIHGWLTHLEGDLLYRLAHTCSGKGVIVEIGSYMGRSTVCLAHGSKAGAGILVHAIDPHTGSPEYADVGEAQQSSLPDFLSNITRAGVDDVVVMHTTTSAAASADFTEPIELLFIDGNHELTAVQQDLRLWLPRVVLGGIVAMHDSVHMAGPALSSRIELFLSGRFKDVRFVHSTTYGVRTERATFWEMTQNRFRLLLRDMYAFMGRRMHSSALKKTLGDIVRRF